MTDPTKLPGARRVPEKTLENLTIAADNAKLMKRDRRNLQKPYVAVEVDEAFKKQGLTLEYFAEKMKLMAETTVIEEEPILEPLLDLNGEVVMEKVVIDGNEMLRPVMSPMYVLKPDGKAVKATKVVRKPDKQALQFVLDTWKEILVANAPKTVEAPDPTDQIKAAASLVEAISNNVDILRAVKKSVGIDAQFEDIT